MGSNGIQERLLNEEVRELERSPDLKRRVWNEVKLLWQISFPSILARVTSFGVLVVTQSFLGHVSELDLAAFALIQSVIIRFVNGVLVSQISVIRSLRTQFCFNYFSTFFFIHFVVNNNISEILYSL